MNANAAFDESRFIHLVRDRGLADDRRAHRAILATLQAFGARVPSPEREALARALPRQLARAISVERFRGGGASELYAAVARTEPTTEGFAHEHVQIVLGALAELLPEELDERARRGLPPSLAELLRGLERPDAEPPPHAETHAVRHRTIATGKPGSAHPLSESPLPGPQTQSVASPNPHADTKLSTAQGGTQEREEESLATAHPGTDRSIAGSHE